MPKPFPGYHGCPTDGTPSFVCTDGLPTDWLHLITLSAPLGRAVQAATDLPNAPTDEVRAAHFQQLAYARQAALNVATTIERITEWSRANLEPTSSPNTRTKSRGSS